MATNTAYYKNALTGGASNALDGINGTSLSDNDLAFALVSDILYVYRLNASSGAAESVPGIIMPDNNAGTKRWILQTTYMADGSITLAKLADMATDKLLGRATAGAGDVEEIPCTAAGRAILDDADAAAQRATLGAAASGANADITSMTGLNTVDFVSEYDNGTVTTATTIDWANGNNQVITLGASVTLTFSNMGVGHKQLRVLQDATGGRVPTLPTGKWPGGTVGTFSTAANAIDILSVYCDGVSYYFQLVKGWA